MLNMPIARKHTSATLYRDMKAIRRANQIASRLALSLLLIAHYQKHIKVAIVACISANANTIFPPSKVPYHTICCVEVTPLLTLRESMYSC